MSGILYGVGVGPGDYELMTLKAVRLIKENEIIAVPGENVTETEAYKIAVKAVAELSEKTLLPIYMPMTHDKEKMAENHKKGAEVIKSYLEKGENVVFLTLGDPSVYSTFLYIQKLTEQNGFKTEMVSGVTSFCAAAARANIPLVKWNEKLYVIPAVHNFEEEIKKDGTYVFMKSGRKMGKIRDMLLKAEKEVIAVENCGMENEQVYYGLDEIPEESGYYSLIIAKEK